MTVHERLPPPGAGPEKPNGSEPGSHRVYADRVVDWGKEKAWPWMNRNRLIAGLGLILFLAALYFTFFSGSGSEPEPLLVPVQRGDVENTVTATGSLQPRNFVDVGAQVSGQLKLIAVENGDEVKKGQLLAEIETAVADARVESDRAQLQNYQSQLIDRQAQLEFATAQAARQERLRAANATSQSEYDSAQAARKSAEAQLKVTQAQIAQAQSTLKADQATQGYAKIYAPMDGTVVSIAAKLGQTLNANQQAPNILRIGDLSVMTVSTQVSEADVPKLRLGMNVYFTTLGAPNRRWTSTLRQIEPTPTVTNNVVLYTALFDVENPNRTLMTQMTAQVFFVISAAHDVLTVPISAVRFTAPVRAVRGGNTDAGRGEGQQRGARNRDQGGQAEGARSERRRGSRERGQAQGGEGTMAPRSRAATVEVVDSFGRRETREVQIGVTNRVSAEVLSGLEEGERVVAGIVVPAARRQNQQGQRGPGGGFGGGGFGGFGRGGTP